MGAKRTFKYGEMKFSDRMVGKHLEVVEFLERERWA